MTLYKKVRKACPHCGRGFTGHPNKRFCNSRCKDNHHNLHNPRGYGAKREDEAHPYSSDAFCR